MRHIEVWTGHLAASMQKALRRSNEAFAAELDVSTRTVANWNAKPNLKLMPESAQLLDTVLLRASDDVRQTFTAIAAAGEGDAAVAEPETAPPSAQLLRVVIAVVVDGDQVLMVRGRGGAIGWQFPAGIVKPDRGQESAEVAVAETFAETGVVCDVRQSLGSRIHPVTGAMCEYLLCDYLSGDAINGDPLENTALAWLDREKVLSVVPKGQLFEPVESLLRESSTEGAASRKPAIAAAVIVRDADVLLVRRRVSEGTLSWQFPAGKVERGETATAAAAREAREETGVEAEADQVIGERTHPVTGRRMIYVACRAIAGEASVVDTDELDAVEWCPVVEVEARLAAGVFGPVLTYLQAAATR